MIETFPNPIKATVLQVMSKFSRRFSQAGRQLDYKVLDSNPVNNTFNLEITPDDSAKLVSPLLTKYKTDHSNSDNLKSVIKETIIRTIFDVD
jgi:hypothetical protein